MEISSLFHDTKTATKVTRQEHFLIAASIQSLSEAVDRVNHRHTLFESALTAAGLDITGASSHVTNPTDEVESMSLSRQDSRHQQYRVELEELAET